MKAKHHLFIAAALCACIALAACTDDANEPATGGHDRTPLVFTAAVHGMPATTRSNTAANQWTDGDVVAVEMNDVVKKYIIKAAAAGATASLRPADEANTHYWPDLNQPVKVRAWRYGTNYYLTGYPWDKKPDAWNVHDAQYNDYNYQESDFIYAPAKSVSYDAAGTGLTFYHQTARVVVKIRKAGVVNDGNKEDLWVYLGRTPTRSEIRVNGTFDASRIAPDAGQFSGLTADETKGRTIIEPKLMPGTPAKGYACCYEALVIPQNMDGKYLIYISVDGKTYHYKPADGEANFRGGYTYTYDITVSEHGRLDVTVGTPIVGWEQQEGGSGTAVLETTPIDLANPQTINDDGAYLMTGQSTASSILNITGGKPLVILRDLLFRGHIHITGGTPEIRVEGKNNELEVANLIRPYIWLDGADANVRITGEGIDKSKLTINRTHPMATMAVVGTIFTGKGEATACGNIEISNLTLEAGSMGPASSYSGAIIGTAGGQGSEKCGNITITDACFISRDIYRAPVIGFGSTGLSSSVDMTSSAYEMGDITITNSTIEAINSAIEGACIGGGINAAATYKVGAIRINTNKSATEFFEKFIGGAMPDEKVYVGFPVGAEPKDGTRFDIYWNGKQVGTEITWGMLPDL